MWFNMLPSWVIYVAFGSMVYYKGFLNPLDCDGRWHRRTMTVWYLTGNLRRDKTLTGNYYTTQGIETIPDAESK